MEALTSKWNTVATGGSDTSVYNKKLHVKHVVDVSASSGQETVDTGKNASMSPSNPVQTVEKMSPEQAYEEIATLKRKYEELVAFSVNLTAERDILNNTLEQTRRDLNREIASRQALEKHGANAGGQGANGSQEKSKGNTSSGGMSINTLILVGILSFFMAVRATNSGTVGVLQSVPVLGGLLGFNKPVAAPRGEDLEKQEL